MRQVMRTMTQGENQHTITYRTKSNVQNDISFAIQHIFDQQTDFITQHLFILS